MKGFSMSFLVIPPPWLCNKGGPGFFLLCLGSAFVGSKCCIVPVLGRNRPRETYFCTCLSCFLAFDKGCGLQLCSLIQRGFTLDFSTLRSAKSFAEA
mgnify:CR=1 FL=1